MKTKHIVAFSASLLVGLPILAQSSDLKLFVETPQRGCNRLSSNDSNQEHFKGGFESAVYGGVSAKVPVLGDYHKESHGCGYVGNIIAGLLPAECNAYVPRNVTQLPPSQIQVFWVVSGAEFNSYTPHFATDPQATAKGYNSAHTGTVRIVGSDSGAVYLEKVDKICGQHNVHDDAVVVNRIPASGPIEVSQATNKITIMHPMENGTTVVSPAPILVRHTGGSDSFWSVFEYPYKGKQHAVVGLHWVIGYSDASLDYLLSASLLKMRNKGQMTKADFVREMQDLGNNSSFSKHGHIPKLLSLFPMQYSLAKAGAAPFARSGFGDFENTHVWTAEPEASVTVSLTGQDYPRPGQVSFVNTSGFTSPKLSQTVQVFLNGAPVGTYVYKIGDKAGHTIDVAIPATLTGDNATIGFKFLNATSPKSLGLGGDPRQLAVRFDQVILKPFSQFMGQYSLARPGAAPFARSGFGEFENTHVWSVNPEASMTVSLTGQDYPRPGQVSFVNTSGFTTEKLSQTVQVFLNGAPVGTYEYTHGDKAGQTIDVAIPATLTGDSATIVFKCLNATSPQSLGLGGDSRQLAVRFDKVLLTPISKSLFQYSLIGPDRAPFPTQGFNVVEKNGVWTEGPHAQITIPLTGQEYPHPKVILFEYTSGFGSIAQPQSMTVESNGVHIDSYQYEIKVGSAKLNSIFIPVPASGDNAVIDFHIHNPVSPKTLGLGDDTRTRGVKFNNVILAL
jgi:hypothetical protein